MPLIIIGLIILVIVIKYSVGFIDKEMSQWLTSIDNPIERGCAYIAIAIVIHAFTIGLQRFSHGTIKIEK